MVGFSRFVLSLGVVLVTALLFLAGCGGFGGDEYNPYVTEILRVEVDPNPVAAGDTTVFTCVIEDSLESEFIFVWNLEGVGNLDTTRTNTYRWIAPSEPKVYAHRVRVEKPSNASLEDVQQRFEVTVVANE